MVCRGLLRGQRSGCLRSPPRRSGSSNGRPAWESRLLSTKSPFLRVSEEVQQAIAEKRPIVALESTIYTHGFPYPENIALASHLESVVRTSGGVPATVGILDGVARVGLDAEEIIRLAGAAGKPDTLKVSRRDLGFACGLGSPGRRFSGGTTVAGTMILAQLAGIKVFATGGLGGVHRGAESSMDISADLTELGRTPVAVISSGCKSFLDISRTLEYLETEGVAVATFADGREGKVDFPAFWSRDSGVRSPMKLRDEVEAAAIILAQRSLGVQSGMLFANPIPEEASIPKEDMDRAIQTAIEEAAAAGITGSANTPFILAKIKELTESRSVTANRALISSNVRRGTLVATELMKLEGQQNFEELTSHSPTFPTVVGPGSENYTSSGVSKAVSRKHDSSKTKTPLPQDANRQDATMKDAIVKVPRHAFSGAIEKPSIFVAGSLAVDFACDYAPRESSKAKTPKASTSNPAEITQTLGGVAHNVARAVQLAGGKVRLCSAIGDDLSGKAAMQALAGEGLSSTGIQIRKDARTAQYMAVNDSNKDLVIAMADMAVLESGSNTSGKTKTSAVVQTFEELWSPQLEDMKPSHLVLDGNWQSDMLLEWLQAGKSISAHVSFEPVSTAKCTGVFQLNPFTALSVYPSTLINLTTPNTYELSAMHSAARSQGFFDREDWWQIIDSLGIPSTGARTQLTLATYPALVDAGIPQQAIQLLPFIPCILTKLGASGVLLTQIIPAGDPRLTSGEYAPYIISRCVNETEDSLGVGGLYMRLFPAVEEVNQDDVVSVNGVGDTFLGTLVAGLEKRGRDARVEDLVDIAQQAAVLTLKSKESVSSDVASLKGLL